MPLALEIAFETLPFVIANLPPLKDVFSKPVGAIKQIVSQSEYWLERVALTMKKKRNVIIITGEIGSGKTTLLSAIWSGLAGAGIQTGGIIATAVYEQDTKTGYTCLLYTSRCV